MGGREQSVSRYKAGGIAGWLIARVFDRLRAGRRASPRLALVERIAVAPRQSVALIEAEGRRILVATSADGASAFYPLDQAARPAQHRTTPFANRTLPSRVSRVSPRIS